MLKHFLFAAILLFSGYLYYTERVITHGPGVVAPDEPAQNHAFGVEEVTFKDFTLKPLAKFNAEARVLSKRAYTSDRLAEISPMDFFVGWGPMSDEKILNELLIGQSDRYFNWQMTHRPIPLQQMVSHTANIHLIPSSDEIKTEMQKVRKGHVITLSGYLVQVDSPQGWTAKSSLKRDDYGEQASEILYVNQVDFVDPVRVNSAIN